MTETMTAAEYRTRVHRVIAKPLDGEPVFCGALFLTMPPPSLNNLFVNARKGRGGRFKSATYKAWQARAFIQLRRQGEWHVPGKVRIRIILNRKETRADLDNVIKPTLDLLMAAGRISDDSNVVEVCAAFESSATGTRIEIRSAA